MKYEIFNFRSPGTRNVRIYSSNEAVCKEDANPLTRLRAGENEFRMEIKTFSEREERVRVHCVHVDTSEIVESWPLQITSDAPNVT